MLLATNLFELISNATYFALAAAALWGLYCIVIVWTRVGQKRFKSEEELDTFMDDVAPMVQDADFEGTLEYVDGDARAVAQMVELGVNNRELGYKRARQVMMDRYQRDVMSDLEYRLNWVSTVIKSAPMIGLFGTVFGMMGAFQTLSQGDVNPQELAGNIMVALITTASGLAIAIPLMIVVQTVNIRMAKMQDLVTAGLTRFLTSFRAGLEKAGIS